MAQQLRLVAYCGHEGQPSCTDYCACEIPRAISTSLIECKTLAEPSLDSAGWCYVSGDAGEPQASLVADCPSVQAQKLRVLGDPGLLSGAPSFLACADSAETVPPRALGEVCFDESLASHFYTHGVEEITITTHTQVCSSGICVANHFQGLVGCPYGQAAGAGDCLIPGTNQAVSGEVKPQLVARQEALASICSCQCEGPGPGPYCTCPESMQCEYLVDDLGFGGASSTYSGSYCIPKNTAYDKHEPQTECLEPNCGVKHPN
jgi:hypothetical protein